MKRPKGSALLRKLPSQKNKTKFLAGFTLIEIMIAVGIIAVLLVLAIPNLLRSRIVANETAATANCRLIYNACQAYYATHIPHTYPPNGLTDLIAPTSVPAYIDEVLAGGTKQGYSFEYQFIDSEHFKLYADPTSPGRTGQRYFYVDEEGIIRANNSQRAGPDDREIP